MKAFDLSHTIVPGMPQWRGDNQSLSIHRLSDHGADSHMSSSLEFGCHIGTHIDAPIHFLDGAAAVDELPLSAFSGPALVIDVRSAVTAAVEQTGKPPVLGLEVLEGQDPTNIEFILFLTGWDSHWGTSRYYEDWPVLSAELSEELAKMKLKGVGLDTPSPDGFGGRVAHDLFAARAMINIENLTGLEALPPRGAWFQALPLKLQRTEASPVRAIAGVSP